MTDSDEAAVKAKYIADRWLGPSVLQETIATALREAEQRGMLRAAEIARGMTGRVRGPIAREIARAIERAAKETNDVE